MNLCKGFLALVLAIASLSGTASANNYGKDTDKNKPQNKGKNYAKEYEKYWKEGDKEEKQENGYEKYWKGKDWSNGGSYDPEEPNDYLDDLHQSLREDAKVLHLDPISMPNSTFKLRVQSQGKKVIIPVSLVNQVLTGIQTIKRVGDGHIQKYYGDPKLGSIFKFTDLEINGAILISNKSCSLFVDIESVTGRLELFLKKNKTEPLTVASLRVFSPEKPTVDIQEGCITDEEVRNELDKKFSDILREDLGTVVRKPLKDALGLKLKPYEGKQ